MDFVFMTKMLISAAWGRFSVILTTVIEFIPSPGIPIVNEVIYGINWLVTQGYIVLQSFVFNLLAIPLLLFTIFGGAVDLFSGITTYDYVERAIRAADEFPQVEYDGYLVWDSLRMADAFIEYNAGSRNILRRPPNVEFNDFRSDMKDLWYKMPQEMMFNDGHYVREHINIYRNHPDLLYLNGSPVHAATVHAQYTIRSVWDPTIGIDFSLMTTAEFRDWWFTYYLYGNDPERGLYLVSKHDGQNLTGRTFEASKQRWNSLNARDWDFGHTAGADPIYTIERGGTGVYIDALGTYNLQERIPHTRGSQALLFSMTSGEFFGAPWGWPGTFGDTHRPVHRQAVIHNVFHAWFFSGTYKYYTYKIEMYYPAKELWIDYIQHMPNVVEFGEEHRRTDDPLRYTNEFLELVKSYGVQLGSDQMYRRISQEILLDNPLRPPGEHDVKRYTLIEIFLGQNAVSFVFWAVTLMSLALCIGFSIVAIIRAIGDGGAKQPLGKTIGGIAKAMLTFLLIPSMVIITINVATVLLQQLDQTMAVAAYAADGRGSDDSDDSTGVRTNRRSRVDIPTAIVLSAITPESLIDPNPHKPWTDAQRQSAYDKLVRDIERGLFDWGNLPSRVHVFRMYLLPAMVAAWFSLFIIIMILMIFIRRIFELVMLYITAPFFVAPMPLDDGAKFKAWKDAFIGKAISGFASILMLRLYLLFVPVIWSSGIAFSTDALADILLKVLFMVGGMYAVYKSHTLITGLVSQQAAQSDKESSTGLVGALTVNTVTSGLQQAASGAISTVAGKPFNIANSHLDKLFMAKKGGGGGSGKSPLNKLGPKDKNETKFSGKTESNDKKPLDNLPEKPQSSPPQPSSQPQPSQPSPSQPQSSPPSSQPSPSQPSQPSPSQPKKPSQPSSSPLKRPSQPNSSSGSDGSPKIYKSRIIRDPGNLPPKTAINKFNKKHFGSAGKNYFPELTPYEESFEKDQGEKRQEHTGHTEGL